jgi:hypothetical protein
MESIKVQGTNPYSSIYVDALGEDVWINIMLSNGSANLCITPENAEKLIEGIRTAITQVKNAS